MPPEHNLNPHLIHQCALIEISKVAESWYRLKLQAPAAAAYAEPGQFVHLRAGLTSDPLLRRPFSIYNADIRANEIWLLIRVAGKATSALAGLSPGVIINILGPLGTGFPVPDDAGGALLVAGGIGLAPLHFLALRRQAAALPTELILGGLTGNALPDDSFFFQDGMQPLIATNDGSRGYRGTAADLLEMRLRSGIRPTRILACGPVSMLARVVELGRKCGLPVYLSLESFLACAVGACLGCAFPFKTDDHIEYRRVCRDGPVFRGEEACFELV